MLIGMDDFANGDAEAIYARMRPDQRTAVANEFVRVLVLAGDPRADDFHYAAEDPFAASDKDYAPPEESGDVQPIVPHLLSPADAARVHRYTREHHPDLFDAVAHHPVTQAALAFPGAEPEPESEPASESERTLWSEAPALPTVPGALPPGPEFLPGTTVLSGMEPGELEKRDHNAINRALGRGPAEPAI